MWNRWIIAAVAVLAGAVLCGCEGDKYTGPTSIMLSSEPTGAAVALDDKDAGYTPMTLDVNPAQNHTIRFTLPGRHTVRATIWRAYNDWNYPGGGTTFLVYASLESGAGAPFMALFLSPLIGLDIVYAVPYLIRSSQVEPLPPLVHAILPPIEPGEKPRIIEWRMGEAERLAIHRARTTQTQPEPAPGRAAATVPEQGPESPNRP